MTTQSRAERRRAMLRRVRQLEPLLYASIWRAVTRRPDVPPGDRGFGFHRPTMPLLLIFIAMTAVELFVLDLVLRRWLVARIVVDVLDTWSLIWMLGVLCALTMRPHLVGADGIHVRDGLGLDVQLPWDDVRAVKPIVRRTGTKSPRVGVVDGVREFALRSRGETNVRIDLAEPTTVTITSLGAGEQAETVERVRLWADDPEAFVEAARRRR